MGTRLFAPERFPPDERRFVRGPKAIVLGRVAQALAECGRMADAWRVEALLEAEPRDALREPRDQALAAIAAAQIEADDPSAAFATATRIDNFDARWTQLLALAVIPHAPDGSAFNREPLRRAARVAPAARRWGVQGGKAPLVAEGNPGLVNLSDVTPIAAAGVWGSGLGFGVPGAVCGVLAAVERSVLGGDVGGDCVSAEPGGLVAQGVVPADRDGDWRSVRGAGGGVFSAEPCSG